VRISGTQPTHDYFHYNRGARLTAVGKPTSRKEREKWGTLMRFYECTHVLHSGSGAPGKHQYVKGEVHTNTVESAFSLLKRGVVGTYHQLSIKHLQRYLNEFSYRFNRREDADLFEQTVGRMAASHRCLCETGGRECVYEIREILAVDHFECIRRCTFTTLILLWTL
jgi:hypothetical protein